MKIYAVVSYIKYFGYSLDESYFFKTKEKAENFIKKYFEDSPDDWDVIEIIVSE